MSARKPARWRIYRHCGLSQWVAERRICGSWLIVRKYASGAEALAAFARGGR